MSRIYDELARVEQSALARGPRTRGLRGRGLGAGEGLAAVALMYWAVGTAVVATVIGVGYGIAKHSAKSGVIAGGITAGVSVAGAGAYAAQQRYAMYSAEQAQRSAGAALLAQMQSFPHANIASGAACASMPTPASCYSCASGRLVNIAHGASHQVDMRCAPASWTGVVG